MSGNDVTLSFTAPNTQKKFADQYIDLVNSGLLVTPASDHIYKVVKRHHKFTFVFADIDDTKIESFFTELKACNVKDAVVCCWFGKTGETDCYAMIKGRVMIFESLEEYEETMVEKSKPASNQVSSLDLFHSKRESKLLVRLRAKTKKKQKMIMDMFTPPQDDVTNDSLQTFEKAVSRIKSPHDNKYRLRCEGGTIGFFGLNDHWYDGPENIMKGFVFIHAEGNYLYLGFDLHKIGWETPKGSPRRKEQELWMRGESLENLVNALSPVFFVSEKSWAKYWLDADNEVFVFSFDDVTASTTRPISRDDDWNLPG